MRPRLATSVLLSAHSKDAQRARGVTPRLLNPEPNETWPALQSVFSRPRSTARLRPDRELLDEQYDGDLAFDAARLGVVDLTLDDLLFRPPAGPGAHGPLVGRIEYLDFHEFVCPLHS